MPGLDQQSDLRRLRHWDATEYPAADVAPHASLRASLTRHDPPPTWVIPGPTGASIIQDAARTAGVGAREQARLPPFAPVELRVGSGPVPPLRFRVLDPAAAIESIGLSWTTGGHDEISLGGARWLDIVVDSEATTIGARPAATRNEALSTLVVRVRADAGADDLSSVALTVAVDSDNGSGGGHLLGALTSVSDRLDEAVPGWRAFAATDDPIFSVEVVATRRDRAHQDRLTRGRVELVSFISDTWDRRIQSGQWALADRSGAPVDPDSLAGYGRRGGLVAYFLGDASLTPAIGEPVRVDRDVGSLLFDGPRTAWVTARRNAETVLQQASMAWYAAVQHGAGDPPSAPAIDALLAALDTCWHPAFGWHIDVVEIVVRGMNRYRWSDPDYPERGTRAVEEMTSHLATRGIRSRPVVLS